MQTCSFTAPFKSTSENRAKSGTQHLGWRRDIAIYEIPGRFTPEGFSLRRLHSPPHPAHRQAGGLADQIPESELDSPGAGMPEPRTPVIPQEIGDLLGLERVAADEPGRDHIA